MCPFLPRVSRQVGLPSCSSQRATWDRGGRQEWRWADASEGSPEGEEVAEMGQETARGWGEHGGRDGSSICQEGLGADKTFNKASSRASCSKGSP
jgi:hypothetical protein